MTVITADKERAQQLYEEAVELVKEILRQGRLRKPIDGRKISELIEKIASQLMVGNKELINLTSRFSRGNYLWCHMVNVAILSVRVGLGLGYNKSRLVRLGVGAFLHDIGMVKVLPLIRKRKSLTKKEYEEIKKHPIYGVEILDRSYKIEPSAISITRQQHERIDGSGYPRSIKNGDIDECARIVGLVDMYEAMTHPRPHREKAPPQRVMKKIIEGSRGLFEQRIIEALVKCLELYPVGSWVQLNTGEIGRVAGIDENFPLRPTITVMFDADYKPLKKMKRIELIKRRRLYVKGSVNESKLSRPLQEGWIPSLRGSAPGRPPEADCHPIRETRLFPSNSLIRIGSSF